MTALTPAASSDAVRAACAPGPEVSARATSVGPARDVSWNSAERANAGAAAAVGAAAATAELDGIASVASKLSTPRSMRLHASDSSGPGRRVSTTVSERTGRPRASRASQGRRGR